MDDVTSQASHDPTPAPLTTPLEQRNIPPQLSNTLEHIVGQLDILTQVVWLEL